MSIERKEEAGGMKVEKKLGVAGDYINAWMMTLNYIKEAEDILDETERAEFLDFAFKALKPIEKYQDYYEKRDYANKDVVLKESNPKKVEEISRLVDEFNLAIPEIKANRDYVRLKDFATKINLLVRGSGEF